MPGSSTHRLALPVSAAAHMMLQQPSPGGLDLPPEAPPASAPLLRLCSSSSCKRSTICWQQWAAVRSSGEEQQ